METAPGDLSAWRNNPLMQVLLPMLILLAMCGVVWWALLDQRLRCQTCLEPLRMPVTLGQLGSILFARAITEYICTQGHGSLLVPVPESGNLDSEHWKPQRDMWEALALVGRE